MKKIFFALILLLGYIVLIPLYCQTVAVPPSNFDDPDAGTEANPFLISNLANLRWLSETVSVWGNPYHEIKHHFLQTADIDATETRQWTDGRGFRTIGKPVQDSMSPLFHGVYYGNNYSIIGLYINEPSALVYHYITMFGVIEDSTIKNLSLVDIDFTGNERVAPLVFMSIQSLIQNCYISGNISSTYYGFGLIYASIYSIIERCYSKVNIQVETALSAAGLVGSMLNSTLKDSFFYGNVLVDSIYNGHQVTGNTAGAVIYANDNSIIENCYVASFDEFVNVNSFVGILNNSTIRNSFWDIETTGILHTVATNQNSEVIEVHGLPTQQMKLSSTYVENGWDFENVWAIDPMTNNGYPYLQLLSTTSEKEYDPIVLLPKFVVTAYPNPVRGNYITFKFDDMKSQSSKVDISIFNIKGQLILKSTETQINDVPITFIWNKDNNHNTEIVNGVYFYKIEMDNSIATGKFLILK